MTNKYYKTKPASLTTAEVGLRQKAYVKKAHGVSRIVRSSYGSKRDWWDLCKQVRSRDRGHCIFCKAKENPKLGVYHDVHHLKPLSSGGTTTLANLGLCCTDCHAKRPGHAHLKVQGTRI